MIDIKYYRTQKNINRLSLQSIHREYNLLEHSYMVSVLFKNFANLEEVQYGMEQFDIIMHHDILEAVSSDLPYPVKSLSDKTKKAWEVIEEELLKEHHQLNKYSDENIKKVLNLRQFALFKVCDYLDLWVFCKEEIALGNKTQPILEVENKCVVLITEICNKNSFIHIPKFIENYEV